MKSVKFSEAMNEIDSKYIYESIDYEKKKITWSKLRKWGTMAACLCVAAALTLSAVLVSGNRQSDQEVIVPQIIQKSPAADSPAGMRKFINYNGSRYAFLENGASYNLAPEQIGDSLGVLEFDIVSDPEANAQKEFSATYAIGGTVREMIGYSRDFRIAVEWENNYYICQKVGRTDGTVMDISEFFKAADFSGTANGISVYDHAGKERLRDIPDEEMTSFIEELERVSPAELSNEQYQAIGKAQKEGKSYQLFLMLNDGTRYSFYLIPSMNIAMIGDNRYMLSDNFADRFGNLFENLSQQQIPAY